MMYQRVNLKVCEGCGTLWFRKQMGTEVYCGPCVDILQHFPDPKTRRRPGRPKKSAGSLAVGGALGLPLKNSSFGVTEGLYAAGGAR